MQSTIESRGAGAGRYLRLEDPNGVVTTRPFVGTRLTVGRALTNDLSLPSYALSRHHARVEVGSDGSVTVVDLSSKNGVWLAGTRIAAGVPVPVQPDQTMDICGFKLRVQAAGQTDMAETLRDSDTRFRTSVPVDGAAASEARSHFMSRSESAVAEPRDLGSLAAVDAQAAADILDGADELMRARDVDEVCERLLDLVHSAIGFDAGYVLSWDEAVGAVIEYSRSSLAAGEASPSIARSVIREAVDTGSAVLTLDAQDLGSAAAVPLVGDSGHVHGVLYVFRRGAEHPYGEADARRLAQATAVAAMQIESLGVDSRGGIAGLEDWQKRAQALESELAVGASIQAGLLPESPPELAGYEMTAFYQPCRQVGGDFYDWLHRPDQGWVGVTFGDVSGKGVGAALMMSSVMTVLRTLLLQLDGRHQFEGFLDRANRTLAYTMAEARYATAWAGILDGASGELMYSNAGQHSMVVRADGTTEDLPSHGTPLGMFPD